MPGKAPCGPSSKTSVRAPRRHAAAHRGRPWATGSGRRESRGTRPVGAARSQLLPTPSVLAGYRGTEPAERAQDGHGGRREQEGCPVA